MIIIVDKPSGMTSQKVVSRIKHALDQKIKIGHTGTLDPMCTGVLPVLIGADTTLSDLFLPQKAYRASFILGVQTDTQDITGTVLEEKPVNVSKDDVLRILPEFTGKILQTPPMYSAIKINGEKLYNLARAGKTVERASRKIEIYSIDYCGYDEENGFYIDVACSKGTYIRTLCNDIGDALGTGACMTSLRRTASNGFYENDVHSLDEVIEHAQNGTIEELSIDSQTPFMHLDEIVLPEDGLKYYLNGGIIASGRIKEKTEYGKRYRAKSIDGRFLGLCEYIESGIKSIWLKDR